VDFEGKRGGNCATLRVDGWVGKVGGEGPQGRRELTKEDRERGKKGGCFVRVHWKGRRDKGSLKKSNKKETRKW